MRKIFLVFFSVFVAFLIENIFIGIFGPRFKPDLLLILVVFFNLSRGIRYSLFTAFLSGLFKDSFSAQPFGFYIFSFISCAYLTTFLKLYIYQPGSPASRVLMVFFISLLNVLIHFFVKGMFVPVRFSEMFAHILLPEVLSTTLVTTMAFHYFKKCVLRYLA